MSMTSQGFPLWAVDGNGAAHVVVGWDEHGYPELVPLGGSVGGTLARRDEAGYIFTTTDPTAQPERWTIAAPDDLRQRLAALAAGLVTSFPHSLAAGHAASRIRQELTK